MTPPYIPDAEDIGSTCVRVMLAIALRQEGNDRRDLLQIMAADGHITGEQAEMLGGGNAG